ncbi:MAG: DJ-1/PfpI family protein [Gammaproteobacteria bacterium]|nr:DJ-1/PfpI family protein [Gammaproteobacteria bacterium]
MNFGFLLFPRLEELDLVGPWEMITTWGQQHGGPRAVFTVSETGGQITCAKGLRIASDYSFDNCPRLDYLLVPGGQGTRTEVSNPRLVYFVAASARSCKAIVSVCTGAFILQAAGLLAHKRATTHFASLERLNALPDVTVVEERVVRDGNVWCAAGISAGIDAALALIADQAGEDAAGKVQLAAEYYPSQKIYGNPGAQGPKYLRNRWP